jgi:hypothetical protein
METKEKVIVGCCMAACLLAGAGAEWVIQNSATLPAADGDGAEGELTASGTVKEVVTVKDKASEAEAEALRKQVSDLKRQLAAAGKTPAPEQPEGGQPPQGNNDGNRQSFRERMEQFKKDHPEQYAEMQKRREEFRQQMNQRAQDRATFLTSIDTRNFTAEQKDNHEKYLAALSKVEELRDQMQQAEPGTETQEQGHQMWDAMRQLGALSQTERDTLLTVAAQAAGYNGSEASEFVDQIKTIYDTTSGGFERHGPPGGGHGPGGGR